MNSKPRLLYVGENDAAELPAALRDTYELVVERNPLRAMIRLKREAFEGVYLNSIVAQRGLQFGSLFETNRILDGMPDGVAVLDEHNTILWANDRLQRWAKRGNIVGDNFYNSLNIPGILGSARTRHRVSAPPRVPPAPTPPQSDPPRSRPAPNRACH